LQRDGYNIVDYSDINEIDDFIRKKYHVVILDIQGVGTNLSEKSEGWGLLKYLKSEAPHTIVIMFTGADWSITKYKTLADSADDFLGKDLEFLDFKSKLDAAIRKAFSLRYHFEIEKRKMISEISNAQSISKIEEILFKSGRNRDLTIKEVKKITSNQSVLNSVDSFLSISSSILELILL
jgi:DNA-binding response OmpR family regulator